LFIWACASRFVIVAVWWCQPPMCDAGVLI
jgi:hypothetical protein